MPSSIIKLNEEILLDCGQRLGNIEVAYQSYGTLSDSADNVILICHAMTGDQYVASPHPLTGKPGWWSNQVGAGRPIDTNRYYVICMNVLGGCMGTTGPTSIRKETGKFWGPDFPPITIGDMVKVQYAALRQLNITRLAAVIGGSMGGMQTLEWSVRYPDWVDSAMIIASAPFHSAQNIAFNEVSRQAILSDPNYHGGWYLDYDTKPEQGLAVARMVAHITYLSEEGLNKKFGRRVRPQALIKEESRFLRTDISFLGNIFEVESYLHYQGSTFIKRFDANSYLTITQAIDRFDLAMHCDGDLRKAFQGTQTRFCIVSFSSDWLFPTSQSQLITRALSQMAADVSFVEIKSDRGHDAFLLDVPEFDAVLKGFLHPLHSQKAKEPYAH